MTLIESIGLEMDGHIRPESQGFQWPAVGSLAYLRQWTFEQGVASLQARAYRYGHEPETPPLSPKSRLVHIAFEEPLASPTTILNRTPLYDDDGTQRTNNNFYEVGHGTLCPPSQAIETLLELELG